MKKIKESIFNIYTETNNHKLLFNSLYCGLCEIDENYFSTLSKIKSGKESLLTDEEKKILELGTEAGFFVNDNFDELNYFRILKYKSKFSEESLTITIAPTLSCNFQCTYCYEDSKYNENIMSESVINKLAQYLNSISTRLQKLNIVWYGGEPLLAKKAIYTLSDKLITICKKNKIEYNAMMVTNGSLLKESDIELLKKYMIQEIQITLDGPPRIHNLRRYCSSIPDNFNLIIDNINMLLDSEISVIIRINVDRTNFSSIEELLQYLSNTLHTKNVYIGFAKVSACTDACSSVAKDCFSSEEFSKKYFDLYDLIVKYGFDKSTPLPYAQPKLNYCGADVYNAFVIDPSGFIYKCWHDVGNKALAIGTVDNVEYALSSPYCEKWLFKDALRSVDCCNCSVLPLCGGGCPSENFYNNRISYCDEIKYNISEIIIKNYYNQLKKGDAL